LAVPVGLLATAILVVNNVRDIDTDRRAGKRTLAVRIGRERTRVLYAALLGASFAAVLAVAVAHFNAWLLLCWLALPLAFAVTRIVQTQADGPSLNGALAKTGQLQLVFCVLLSAGLLLSR
jgi:1,4-dihydroxy-2-naphthoate octaprenyltransferase